MKLAFWTKKLSSVGLCVFFCSNKNHQKFYIPDNLNELLDYLLVNIRKKLYNLSRVTTSLQHIIEKLKLERHLRVCYLRTFLFKVKTVGVKDVQN